jgi:CheY-like chemotaxis protein
LQKSSTDQQEVEWLELCVADSGAGIARELQERIFEPYFTTKEKEQGTGMGLAMVHGIVKRWGGRIELKSEEGQGAAFHLFFPCVASEKNDDQGITYDQALVGTEKIMVVDDQEAVLKVTKKILDTLGYTVSIFSSSREAFECFSSAPDAFDLIITDFAMPSMTGMELCAEVKKQRGNMPIILCTGYGEKFTDKDVAKAGFSAWFTKPVSLKNLASTVRNVLDSTK